MRPNGLFFEFDDVLIPLEATVDSKFDIDLYVVNLSYDIYQTNRDQISLGLGAHIADLDLKIAGTLRSGDNTVPLEVGDESILAPRPNLFVASTYALKGKPDPELRRGLDESELWQLQRRLGFRKRDIGILAVGF